MPEFDNDEFKFPDENASESKRKSEDSESGFQLEVEDDTPPQDRNREPMPKPLVEELEKDELDKYDDEVKNKLKQMRKVWHDERREKEAALREQQETLNVAQRLLKKTNVLKLFSQMVKKSTLLQYRMPPTWSWKWQKGHTVKRMTPVILTRSLRLSKLYKVPITK